MASLFDTTQEGVNPVTASVAPVVDKSIGIALQGAAAVTEGAFDIRDTMLTGELREDLSGIAEEAEEFESSRNQLIDQIGQAGSEQDTERVAALSKDLGRMMRGERQGVRTRSQLTTHQNKLMREFITDNPHLVTEARSLASAYGMAGFGGGSSSGTSGSKTGVEKLYDTMAAEALKMEWLGVPPEHKVAMYRQGLMNAGQLDYIGKVESATFNDGMLREIENHYWGTMSEFTKELQAQIATPGGFDPEKLQTMVDRQVGDYTQAAYRRLAQAKAAGSDISTTRADIDSMVKQRFGVFEQLIKADNPARRIEEYNKQRVSYSLHEQHKVNPILRVIHDMTGVTSDPSNSRAWDAANDLHRNLMKLAKQFGGVDKVPEDARMAPGIKGFYQALAVDRATGVQGLLDVTRSTWESTGRVPSDPIGTETTVTVASTEGTASTPDSRAAWNATKNTEGTSIYRAASKATALTQQQVADLRNRAQLDSDTLDTVMNRSMIREVSQDVGDPEAGGTIEQVGGDIRYRIDYDPNTSTFTPVEVFTDGRERKLLDSFYLDPETVAFSRSVRVLNSQLAARSKWGVFDDGGDKWNSRNEFIGYWSTKHRQENFGVLASRTTKQEGAEVTVSQGEELTLATPVSLGRGAKAARDGEGLGKPSFGEGVKLGKPSYLKDAPNLTAQEVYGIGDEGGEDVSFPSKESGLNLIARFENARQEGRSKGGLWTPHVSIEGGTDTIGYGHKLTKEEVDKGTINVGGVEKDYTSGLTDEEVTLLLEQDTKIAADAAEKLIVPRVWVRLGEDQREAIISLIYNVGEGAFARSNALKALNKEQFFTFIEEAFDSEKGFVKVGGKVNKGLVRRRAKEAALFNPSGMQLLLNSMFGK